MEQFEASELLKKSVELDASNGWIQLYELEEDPPSRYPRKFFEVNVKKEVDVKLKLAQDRYQNMNRNLASYWKRFCKFGANEKVLEETLHNSPTDSSLFGFVLNYVNKSGEFPIGYTPESVGMDEIKSKTFEKRKMLAEMEKVILSSSSSHFESHYSGFVAREKEARMSEHEADH